MSLKKNKIEELLTAAQRITAAQNNSSHLLFDISTTETDLNHLLDDNIIQDPEKSYDLFYNGIQNFLLKTIPKGDTRTVILELKSILLTGREKERIKTGKRGADSRMSKTERMENVIDVLSEWSTTPNDYLKLSFLLLNKNIELGYSPSHREISDFL